MNNTWPLKILALIIALATSMQTIAQENNALQSVTLDSCLAWAKQNYPLVKQKEYLNQTLDLSLENIAKGKLPRVQVLGQATYQSEVTSIPISLPGITIPELNKDQYRLYSEINQPISDLFLVKNHANALKANIEVEQQKLEVNLYQLNERILQVYFGILLINKQLEQLRIVKTELNANTQKLQAAIENGVQIESSLYELQAEALSVQQKELEVQTSRTVLINLLGLYTNNYFTSETYFQIPEFTEFSATNNRLELALFKAQNEAINSQLTLLNNSKLPRLSAFAQGGFGRPALNMLNNEFRAYAIGGLRLQWNLSAFYTLKNNKQLLLVQHETIALQKELFDFNTSLLINQQMETIAKYNALISSDEAIIQLRVKVKETLAAQLNLGTATSAEYIHALSAESAALQNLSIHQIERLQAQYTSKFLLGN